MIQNRTFNPVQAILLVPLLIAIAMFVLVVINLAVAGLPAVQRFGLNSLLLSTELSTPVHGITDPEKVGLLAPLWGTFLTLLIALPIALPVSLAMAIFASEFKLGGLGSVMETLLVLFAGIPPVIYGLSAIFLSTAFS